MNNAITLTDFNDIPKKIAVDFLDTTESTQLTVSQKPVPVLTVSTKDYLKICNDLWNNKNLLINYQKGLFLGRGDYSHVLFSEFLKMFRKFLEEIIREELQKNNQTSESFKDDFKTIEYLFNMLITHLASNKIEFKDEKIMATLHGFVNAYVDPIINTNKES